MVDFRYILVPNEFAAFELVRELLTCGFQRQQIGLFSGHISALRNAQSQLEVSICGGIEEIGDFLDPSAATAFYRPVSPRPHKIRHAVERAASITRLMRTLVVTGDIAVVVRACTEDSARRMERVSELGQRFGRLPR